MSEQELKKFRKTLAGTGALPLEPNDPYYVSIFEDAPAKDPIARLLHNIMEAESQSVNLLTGFRGNGKSTQLKRLKQLLENAGCHVVLVDMADYVLMTRPPEISDFLLSLMAALAVKSKEAGYDKISMSYWERLQAFMQNERHQPL